jgi:hypothetical protein
MITINYRSVDGYRLTRRYKTVKGARAFAVKWVGKHPDIGSSYAVSFDGIGIIRAEGISLEALFEDA